MKKILIFSLLVSVLASSCKKDPGDPSITVTAYTTVITVSGDQYYSIPVGGNLPSVTATAYDTFYDAGRHHPLAVVQDASSLDNTTPGLYTITLSASNQYGFVTHKSVYVAVTNESAALDISGTYIRTVSPANPNRVAHITKLATGMFMTDNVGGVDVTDPTTGAKVSAVFVAIDDATIDFGSQLTDAGPLTASSTSMSLVGTGAAGTTVAYALNLSGFGTSVRTFVKQ